MLVVFLDLRGIATHIMPKFLTVTARYYSELILKNLRGKLKKYVRNRNHVTRDIRLLGLEQKSNSP